jgi:2-hydroxy-6-oxo-6-(2'-carboxyphenyl)-hexa-2,4-dienoate hydrolase
LPTATRRLARIEDFAPPEEFVMVGPVKTHFVAKGATGRPVVLLHGFGSSTYTWQKNLGELSKRHRVYALDMKGFGLTAKPRDGEYHPDAYARHLLGFLDVMRLDRPVLVGHSLGGSVVARLALLHPERVAGLVLVAPAPLWFRHAPGGPDARAIPTKPVAAADAPVPTGVAAPAPARRVLPALLRAGITRQTVESALRAAFHDPRLITPEMVEAYYRPLTIEGAAEALAAMLNPPPLELAVPLPPLRTLKVPTLVVLGQHDRVVPAQGERYARAIPGARRVVFAHSGHVPHEEEPEAFNARLIEFLDQVDRER